MVDEEETCIYASIANVIRCYICMNVRHGEGRRAITEAQLNSRAADARDIAWRLTRKTCIFLYLLERLCAENVLVNFSVT